MAAPYFVSHANCTDLEPSPGWYVSVDDGGHEVRLGPFTQKQDARVAAEERQSEVQAGAAKAVQAILDANSHAFDFDCAADREEAVGLVAREYAALTERLEDRKNAVRDLNRLVADLSQQRNSLEAKVAELLGALKHLVHWHDQLSTADIARAEAAIAKAEGRLA